LVSLNFSGVKIDYFFAKYFLYQKITIIYSKTIQKTSLLVMIYPGPGKETWVPISLRCGYPGTHL